MDVCATSAAFSVTRPSELWCHEKWPNFGRAYYRFPFSYRPRSSSAEVIEQQVPQAKISKLDHSLRSEGAYVLGRSFSDRQLSGQQAHIRPDRQAIWAEPGRYYETGNRGNPAQQG